MFISVYRYSVLSLFLYIVPSSLYIVPISVSSILVLLCSYIISYILNSPKSNILLVFFVTILISKLNLLGVDIFCNRYLSNNLKSVVFSSYFNE